MVSHVYDGRKSKGGKVTMIVAQTNPARFLPGFGAKGYYTKGAAAKMRERYGFEPEAHEWRRAHEGITSRTATLVGSLSEHGREWRVRMRGRSVRLVFDVLAGVIISALPPPPEDAELPPEEEGERKGMGGRPGPMTPEAREKRQGEGCSSHSLTEGKVLEMRRLRAEDPSLSYAKIGRMFGVQSQGARRAILGETWGHLK